MGVGRIKQTSLLATVFERCVHCGGDDGARPRHDAKEPDLSQLTRSAERHVLLRLSFLPVNALFLGMGILLYALCAQQGITPPATGDELLPGLVNSGALGQWVIVPFTIGIVAAAFRVPTRR